MMTRTRFLLGLLVGAMAAALGLANLPTRTSAGWGVDERAMVPRMHAFTRALTEPPSNGDPAPDWRPLLRDAESRELLCSMCHGDSGVRMERAIGEGELALDPPPGELESKQMEALMERWMRQLNRHGRERLVKTVHCIDCHETDPRD